jgi:hypothetical protein
MNESSNGNVSVVLGSTPGDRLEIRALRRNYPDCADYWDGNWLGCIIEVRAGGFRGQVEADLRAEEFETFRDAFRRLYNQLAGEATFSTMEGWLTIKVVGDGRGHFTADSVLRDRAGMGNQLTFTIAFDQTDLSKIIRELETVVVAFPVVSQP